MFKINYPSKKEYAELLNDMVTQFFEKQKEFYLKNSIGDPNFVFYVGMKEWYAIRLVDLHSNYAPTIRIDGDLQWFNSPVIRVTKDSYFHLALKD